MHLSDLDLGLTYDQVLNAHEIHGITADYPRKTLSSIFIFQKEHEDEITSFDVQNRHWFLKNADNFNDYYDSELMLDQLVSIEPKEAAGIIFDGNTWNPK